MLPALSLLFVLLTATSRVQAQNVRAVDHYITDSRPAAGIGIGEDAPRRSAPELSLRIDTPYISKETEETIEVEDDVSRRRTPDLKPQIDSQYASRQTEESVENREDVSRRRTSDLKPQIDSQYASRQTEESVEIREDGSRRRTSDLKPGIGAPPISRETEETLSYVEDVLADRVSPSGQLAKPGSDYDVATSEELHPKKERLGLGVDPIEDDYQTGSITDKAHSARQTNPPRVNRVHPASPCPSVFSYEGNRAGKSRWYGVMLVSTDATLTGIRIEIRLNRPASLLGTWFGEVSSVDNIGYTIWNGRRKIEPGPPLSIKIFVTYSESEYDPPRISTIRLNGRQICPNGAGSSPLVTHRPAPATVRPEVIRPTRPAVPARPTMPAKPVAPARPVATARPKPTTKPSVTQRPPATSQNVDEAQCGKIEVQPSPLITYGQRTAKGQWPWHVALYQSRGTDLTYVCGGSLIGKKNILTAAHCVSRTYNDRPVDTDLLVVYVGKYHLKLWSEGGVQNKQVREIIIHPDYNSTDFHADIAILELSSPVEFSIYVKPVCLWNRNRVALSEVEGVEGVVVGWGYDQRGVVTEELMMARMPIVSQQTCIWSYPQFFSRFTSEKTYCAGFRNGTSVCNGDSGGGMVFPMRDGPQSPEIWHLRGLVSLGTSQEDKRVCNTKHYVVFTDVAKYLDWIDKYLRR